jgi:O-antigen ligase
LILAGILRDQTGRAAWPSFFVFGAALALLAAALLKGNAYRWGALLLLVAAFLAAPARKLPVNALSVMLALYCGWLLCSAAFLTPNYSAESLYRPAILLAGFAATAAYGRAALPGLFRTGTLLLALLVLLGLLQLFFGFWHLEQNSQRAAATFITPNTFATAINLFLLPLIALYVMQRGGLPTYPLALWLFVGLISTESRGGYLGFAAGCVFIAVWAAASGVPWLWRQALKMAVGLAAAAAAFTAMVLLVPPSGGPEAFGSTLISRGTNLRPELAAVAVRDVWENPVFGTGANMFRVLFEMHRPAQLDNASIYLFVHNDFLQIWLEYGLLGLVLLGTLVVLSLMAPGAARVARADGAAVLACGAALSSCFAHAVVDFPLYVPFLLLIVGAYLGALAVYRGDDDRMARLVAPMASRLAQIRAPLLVGALAAGLAWLSQPVLAEVAANRSLAALFAGDLEAGLRWQALARWLEPRNPIHYWAEGVMWREQAKSTGKRALAAKADEMFAEGMRTNPYEIVNHLERARLQRLHAALFERPAAPGEVVAWTGEAVRLRPYSMPARIEHARSLANAGRTDEARRLANSLLGRYPGSETVLRLASDLKI